MPLEDINRDIKIVLKAGLKGDKGPKGDAGDLTPDLVNARDSAVAAATSASADAVSSAQNAEQTASDRIATGEDRGVTTSDRLQTQQDSAATAADRLQTTSDRQATQEFRDSASGHRAAAQAAAASASNDAIATASDRFQTGRDLVETSADRMAAAQSAASAIESKNAAAQSAEDAQAYDPSPFLAHIQRNDNPHGVTKNQIGLGNVDNTSDLNKPISTLTQNAIDAKLDGTAPSIKPGGSPSSGARMTIQGGPSDTRQGVIDINASQVRGITGAKDGTDGRVGWSIDPSGALAQPHKPYAFCTFGVAGAGSYKTLSLASGRGFTLFPNGYHIVAPVLGQYWVSVEFLPGNGQTTAEIQINAASTPGSASAPAAGNTSTSVSKIVTLAAGDLIAPFIAAGDVINDFRFNRFVVEFIG